MSGLLTRTLRRSRTPPGNPVACMKRWRPSPIALGRRLVGEHLRRAGLRRQATTRRLQFRLLPGGLQMTSPRPPKGLQLVDYSSSNLPRSEGARTEVRDGGTGASRS